MVMRIVVSLRSVLQAGLFWQGGPTLEPVLPRYHRSSAFSFGGRRGNVERVSYVFSFRYSNFV
ncbi:hypothetical protein GYMLUDRAFT_415142 [Collybiopsis luxurians FD-317 M1]|nr:hypothetical protein GYMLUDRAFT_415142 [Collybiopsis luxurians FD-317 M1]